jgi:hypothetical protein
MVFASDSEWLEIAELNWLRRPPQSALAACPITQKMIVEMIVHLGIETLAIIMTKSPYVLH